MSDMLPSTSGRVSATVSTETVVELEEPPKKRIKGSKESMVLDAANSSPTSSMCAVSEKLENRLGGILCCTVCLDLPKAAVFQCPNGHLMCAACFTHILADSRIRDESASCPNCRTDISKTNATRNLAVEKAISELPSKCQFCAKKFPRNTLARHEESQCEDRKSKCKYSRIGCLWIGPEHERLQHEAQCIHPKNTGDKIMEALEVIDLKVEEERRFFNNVLDLLSYEKLIFIDFQLKPYRTDEFIHRLFFESSRFSAFNHQWVVKARISETQRDPSQCTERDISYQLILRSKCNSSFTLHFLVLPGPVADLKLRTNVSKHEYNEQKNESPHFPLPLDGVNECNRFLSMKTIELRILMFMAPK